MNLVDKADQILEKELAEAAELAEQESLKRMEALESRLNAMLSSAEERSADVESRLANVSRRVEACAVKLEQTAEQGIEQLRFALRRVEALLWLVLALCLGLIVLVWWLARA